ncbi:hypothetical protein EX30DRAFT_319109, partial [Ascodesmis nigricans]
MSHSLLLPLNLLIPIASIRNILINRIVPDPYLDEVFHIPQAQRYCQHGFSAPYDPKLTTPPGLYLLSHPLSVLLGSEIGCSPALLRAVNVVGGSIVLPFVYHRIRRKLYGNTVEDAVHTAVNCTVFPLVWFFTGLYYTDVWSAVFVMLCWLGALRQRYWAAALMGWVSLWFRQTNVVWVGYALGVATVRELGVRDVRLRDMTVKDLATLPLNIMTTTLTNPRRLLSLTPFLLTLLSFAAFIAYNNFTIVLGDASAHIASLHTPQLLYFSAATAFFSWPLFFSLFPRLACARTWAWILGGGAAVMPLMVAAVKWNTVLHPYLMADNRHYAFYVFRRIVLRTWWSRYALVPGYWGAWWGMVALLVREASSVAQPASSSSSMKEPTMKPAPVTTITTPPPPLPSPTLAATLLWLLATTLTLISAPLVEPRYFILAWLVWRLQTPPLVRGRWMLWAETLWM